MLSFFDLLMHLVDIFGFLRNILPLAKYPDEPWYWRWGGMAMFLLTLGTGLAGLGGSQLCAGVSFAGAVVLLIVIVLRTLIIEEHEHFKE